MDESLATYDYFNWRLPLYAAAGTLIAYLPITMLDYDIGWLLYAFVWSLHSSVLFWSGLRLDIEVAED